VIDVIDVPCSAVGGVSGRVTPGAMAIFCEQRRGRDHGPTPLVVSFSEHVREREVIPHDLGGYDD